MSSYLVYTRFVETGTLSVQELLPNFGLNSRTESVPVLGNLEQTNEPILIPVEEVPMKIFKEQVLLEILLMQVPLKII